VNLIANAGFIFMLFFFFVVSILCISMRISLILIDSLQCDRIDHTFDRFFVSEKILVCVSISTGLFEEIQGFFDRLMLNCPRLAKDACSSLICTKKFMNEDDIIVECVSQSLIYHLSSEIFSFADSLLDICLDERRF
jgi:hypothetical protein